MIELLVEAEQLLSVGLLDRAESLYRQAAAHDPRNAMAVVGLARVALERGDERSSHALAAAALEIDAENLAARRIASRTADVLVARGEALPPAAVPSSDRIGRQAQPASADPHPPSPGPRRRGIWHRFLGGR